MKKNASPSSIEIPLRELLERAYRALLKELGPEGMIQFLCSLQCGRDYDEQNHHQRLHNVSAKAKTKTTKRRRPKSA